MPVPTKRPTKKAVKQPIKRAPKRVAKRPSAVHVPRPEGVGDELSPGDTIEYSISMEIRGPAGALWLKAGVTSVVRAAESTQDAESRVTGYVERVVRTKADGIAKGRV